MKASQVTISDLKTSSDMYETIEKIEGDYQNTVGGISAWTSGYDTHLTKTAEKKIEAINAKLDRMFPCEDGE